MPLARKKSTATNSNVSAKMDGKETERLARLARRLIPVHRIGRNGRFGRVVRRHAAEDSKHATEFASLAAPATQNATNHRPVTHKPENA